MILAAMALASTLSGHGRGESRLGDRFYSAPFAFGDGAWIQVSSATVDLKAASSSAVASSGVFHPRVLRGRWFIRRATSLSWV